MKTKIFKIMFWLVDIIIIVASYFFAKNEADIIYYKFGFIYGEEFYHWTINLGSVIVFISIMSVLFVCWLDTSRLRYLYRTITSLVFILILVINNRWATEETWKEIAMNHVIYIGSFLLTFLLAWLWKKAKKDKPVDRYDYKGMSDKRRKRVNELNNS